VTAIERTRRAPAAIEAWEPDVNAFSEPCAAAWEALLAPARRNPVLQG
jgi:hypothetical protein